MNFDAYAPAAIRERVSVAAATKAATPAGRIFVLAVLAGVFIGLGAIASLVVSGVGSPPDSGVLRTAAGLAFSVGLALVVVAGAELFTGDNLMVMGWVDGRVSLGELARTWAIVAAGNVVGSVVLAVAWAWSLPHADVVTRTLAVAAGKAALGAGPACLRGVLCNVLVCLAVWGVFSCRSTGEKLLVVMLPVATFVAAGFEHSVANVFIFGSAWMLGPIDVPGALHNLAWVTLGNIFGGSGLVAGAYLFAYGRAPTPPAA